MNKAESKILCLTDNSIVWGNALMKAVSDAYTKPSGTRTSVEEQFPLIRLYDALSEETYYKISRMLSRLDVPVLSVWNRFTISGLLGRRMSIGDGLSDLDLETDGDYIGKLQDVFNISSEGLGLCAQYVLFKQAAKWKDTEKTYMWCKGQIGNRIEYQPIDANKILLLFRRCTVQGLYKRLEECCKQLEDVLTQYSYSKMTCDTIKRFKLIMDDWIETYISVYDRY